MFEITLSPVKSALDGIKLFEVYDRKSLISLLTSDLLLETPHKHIQKKFETEKQQIEEYDELSTDHELGMVQVTYSRCKGYNYGRVYPRKSLSLCTIRRPVRHTLGMEYYVDIDVYNAHPELIYQTCKYHNIKCEKLGEYVLQRQDKLEFIMNTYKVDRDQAKKLFIIILYFGTFETWVKDCSLPKDTQPIKFINELIEERNIYANEIIEANEDLCLEVQKNKIKANKYEYNENASVVALWCQEIENRILETIYEYCIKNKIIEDKIAVLCYDGIMLEKQKFNEKLLDKFSEIIEKEFGYKLKYESKSLLSGYSKSDLKDHYIYNEENDKLYQDYKDKSELMRDNVLESTGKETKEVKEVKEDFKAFDKEFFKSIETIGHRQCADIYYKLKPTKYIYSTKSGWYRYNQYNVLESTGKETPIDINVDISKTLQEYLIPIRNRMKPNKNSYVKDSKNINKLFKDINNSSYIKGTLNFLKELYSSEDIDDKIDNNENLIAFIDKVFDKKTYTIRDIKPDDYISKTTRYKYSKSKPEIRKQINEMIYSIFEDNQSKDYLLRLKAESLFGNVDESLVIQIGSGGNGKGAMSTLENNSLGDYISTTENTFLTSSTKRGAFDETLSKSKGLRNLIISEPSEVDEFGKEVSLNTPFLKLITGRDAITTRAIFKGNFTFIPQFTPFIQCNDLPNIKKIDKGIMRRIKVIKFPLSFVDNPDPNKPNERKINKKYKELLKTEDFGREYLLMLLDIIISNKDKKDEIKIPDCVKEATNNYFTENNPVKTFLEYFTKSSKGSKVKSSLAKEHYDNNSETKLSDKQFLKLMSSNGIDNYMSTGYRYYKDIELTEPQDEKTEKNKIKKII
jgi:P4 family phage/plasmid primase-like protien